MSASALLPVPRTTLTREVAERLRQAILSGELVAGQQLAEATMASRLNVSRVPVREALVELEREGLVVFNERGRACVRAFTDEDFAEIVSLRTTLQVMSAKLAAVKHTVEDLERLEMIVKRADKTRDPTEFSRLDIAFHDEIARIARHQRLYQAWSNLRAQMELWIVRAHRERERVKHDVHAATARAHRAMIEVLRSRDPGEAARLMEFHCESMIKVQD
ncbi:MAG: GntR family transcriptional regulator [Planctomycetia bacterium]|nr:GntR family transcriptional regulator [Planctomycetia bacterium]